MLLLGGAVGFGGGALWMLLRLSPEPPAVAPAQGYLLRRVDLRLHDHRTGPEGRTPSWTLPRASFTCTEDVPLKPPITKK
jgi:hypothetical protein